MSKVLIISSSLRNKSNSLVLANKVLDGALSIGHDAKLISLKGKKH